MTGMNWLDYIFIAILLFSGLFGLMRGFVKEVLSLVFLIAAFVVASMFSASLAASFTSSPSVQGAVSEATNAIGVNAAQPISYAAIGVSFSLLFAGTLLTGAIFTYVVNLAFQTGLLGLGNRLLGGVFGLARGVIFNLVIERIPFFS